MWSPPSPDTPRVGESLEGGRSSMMVWDAVHRKDMVSKMTIEI